MAPVTGAEALPGSPATRHRLPLVDGSTTGRGDEPVRSGTGVGGLDSVAAGSMRVVLSPPGIEVQHLCVNAAG